MPNWKKVITSGSNASLNQITASAFQFVGSGTAELEVQGHITASGNISASGNMIANSVTAEVGNITVDEGNLSISKGVLILGLDPQINVGATEVLKFSSNSNTPQLFQNGSPVSASSFIAGAHITASGNISSSGNVFGLIGDFTTRVHTPEIRSNDTALVTISDSLRVTANITASGNISSSGTIKAATLDADAVTDGLAAVIVAEIDNDEIPIAKLAEDAITIAGTSTTLGGSITADTIAGQISADTISGNQINGGTIGSVTISQLGGALDVNNENITNIDVNSGTIDGTTIGGASAAAGTFTTLNATSLNVTSITSSIVTSSILQTEGSNIFGDTNTDTHTFNGSITASADISASGTIKAKTLDADAVTDGLAAAIVAEIDNDEIPIAKLAEDSITIAGTSTELGGSITSAAILNNGKATISGSFTDASSSLAGRVAANEVVTAKTLVSSSGQINSLINDTIAATIVAEIDNDEIPIAKLAEDAVTITAGDGLKTGGSVTLGSSVTLDVDVSDFAGTGLSGDGSENLNVDAAQTQITSVGTLTGLNVDGHITASGNISSSGTIEANGNISTNAIINAPEGVFTDNIEINKTAIPKLQLKDGTNDRKLVIQVANTVTDFINNDNAAHDLRFKLHGEDNHLYLEAQNNRVGIGDNAPNQKLGIKGTNAQISIEEDDTEFLRLGVGETENDAIIGYHDDNFLRFGVYSSPTDTSIDTHMSIGPTGHITASHNISSSGTITMLTASIGGGIFTSASLAAGGSGGSTTNAAGSDTQVQFNDGGTNFGGDAGLVFNKTSNLLTAGAITSTGDITANGNIAGDNSTNISGINDLTMLGDFEGRGNNTFGNAITDQHTFNGHITASGNISGSNGNILGFNTITATSLAGTLTTAAQTNITSLGTLTTLAVDDITINGSTISDTQDLTINPARDLYIDVTENGEIYFQHDGGDTVFQFNLDSTPELDVTGHFTIDCSSDITLDAAGKDISLTDGAGTAEFIFNLEDAPEIDVDGDFTIDGSGLIKLDSATNIVDLVGNVTASGNISSSGTIQSTGNITSDGNVNAGGFLTFGASSLFRLQEQPTGTAELGGGNFIKLGAPTEVDGHITASGNISSSGTITMLTASIGGGIFTSASLAAGGGGGGGSFSFTGNQFATDLKVGRDSDNHIDFTTDNQIDFDIDGATAVTLINTSDSGSIAVSGSIKVQPQQLVPATSESRLYNKTTANGLVVDDLHFGNAGLTPAFAWVTLDDDGTDTSSETIFGVGSAVTSTTHNMSVVHDSSTDGTRIYSLLDGVYKVTGAFIIDDSSGTSAEGVSDIKVDGSTVHTANFRAHQSVDPVERTHIYVGSINSGSYVTATYDGTSARYDQSSVLLVERLS